MPLCDIKIEELSQSL